MEIPKEELDRIVKEIESPGSPVGIDAKKTHAVIIHKLNEIEKRLSNLERLHNFKYPPLKIQ
jgi:hypothetical protein